MASIPPAHDLVVSITFGNSPLVLSHSLLTQYRRRRGRPHVSPFLNPRIHNQNHMELEDPYIKTPVGKQQNANSSISRLASEGDLDN